MLKQRAPSNMSCVRAEPGGRPGVLHMNTVVWRGMRTHDTARIEAFAPAEVTVWRSELDADGFSVTLNEEGAYIYTCDGRMKRALARRMSGRAIPCQIDSRALARRGRPVL